VYNRQHDGGIRLNTSRSDRVPALFPRFVYAVRTHEAAIVFEYQRRHFKNEIPCFLWFSRFFSSSHS
jgi:hypothetical protein